MHDLWKAEEQLRQTIFSIPVIPASQVLHSVAILFGSGVMQYHNNHNSRKQVNSNQITVLQQIVT